MTEYENEIYLDCSCTKNSKYAFGTSKIFKKFIKVLKCLSCGDTLKVVKKDKVTYKNGKRDKVETYE